MWRIAGGATDSPTTDSLKKTLRPSWDATLMLSGSILGFSESLHQIITLRKAEKATNSAKQRSKQNPKS